MITINNNIFTLENKYLKRELEFSKGGLQTIELINKVTESVLSQDISGSEFMLKIDTNTLHGSCKKIEHILDGNMTESNLSLHFINAKISKDDDWDILKINMATSNDLLIITCCYGINDEFPSMRKWLELRATETVKISNIYIECLHAYPGKLRDVEIFRSDFPNIPYTYFSARSEVDSVQLYNRVSKEGYFLSSNLPGPLRHFLVYPHWVETSLSVGYNKEIPNTIYLDQGEVFKTHEAYLHLYKGSANDIDVRNGYTRFIRDRLPVMPNREGVMYCTWVPFMKNIDENLIYGLIDKASELEFKYFVIDDGWFIDPEWKVDKKKFPNGLGPIADYIHDKGMFFGLWFNIGTDYGNTRANTKNDRKDIDNNDEVLGFYGNRNVQCLASEHRDIASDKLLELSRQYGVDYFKMDFSSIVSPYGILPPGCHCENHEYHKNHADSVIAEYESMKYIREKVKKEFPYVILDFSFETFGTENPGIAALQYSELHHVSNMDTNNLEKYSALMIRNNFYKFFTALPVERLLGALICLQGDDVEVIFENLATSLMLSPLVAGNLLELNDDAVAEIKAVQRLIIPIFNKGDLTNFIKIHDTSHVEENDLDGYIRYNPSGWGLIAVFVNNSEKRSEVISISDIPQGNYILKNSNNEEIETSAEELKNGFTIKWTGKCELFSFKKIN